MWTINDLIKTGMDFFTGKTVLKDSADAAANEWKAKHEASEGARVKLADSLAGEKARADKAETDLVAARADVIAKEERIQLLEKESKTAAEKAATIAATAGHDGPVPIKQPAATGEPGTLQEQFDKISNPKARAEFLREHGDKLMAESISALKLQRKA